MMNWYLGGGESGVGSAILAKVKGLSVFLSDSGLLKEEHRKTLSTMESISKRRPLLKRRFYRQVRW